MLSNNKIISKSYTAKKPAPPAPEEIPKTSYLADLFRPPSDDVIAAAEKDLRFGYIPKSTVASSSFTL